MGGALGLSVLAHALALAVWLHANRHDSGPLRISRQHGGITVQLVSMRRQSATQSAAQAQPSRGAVAQSFRSAKADAPAPGRKAAAQPAQTPTAATAGDVAHAAAIALPPDAAVPAVPAASASVTSQASVDAPEAAPAPMPAAKPGARFASLFAPLVSQPIGHGRWHSATAPRPPQEAMAAMQREQAIAGIRQAVLRQAEHLQGLLQDQALQGGCDARLSLDRQLAQLRCDSSADLPRLAAALQGALRLSEALPPLPSDTCLRASGSTLSWVDCPAP